jgi:hypothetical protein
LPYRASAEFKIQNPFLVIQGECRVQNDGGQQDVEEEGGGELREGILCLIPWKQKLKTELKVVAAFEL